MAFSKQAFYFNKRKVCDFDPGKGIADPAIAYRFRCEYEDAEDTVLKNLTAFLNDPRLPEVDSFVVGMWGEYDAGPEGLIELLLANKDKLQHIKGIFFGDITYEENEVSWIQNGNYGHLLDALPHLEFFQVRGGNGLGLGSLKHPGLKKLVIQTGGLDVGVLKQIANADLPALEHLEIWLGSDYYGFNASPEDIKTVYTGHQEGHLPALKYLGLRNCEIADAVALGFKDDPILERIEELDLSRGNLGDVGAQALVENPAIKNLKKLDLHHNYISDEWAEKLQNLGMKIDLKDRRPNTAEDERYISVSE